MSRRQDIAVVDPSFFTLPYDIHLCAGIVDGTGFTVTLYGRKLRKGELCENQTFEMRNWYYTYSESIAGRQTLTRNLRNVLKVIEHAWDTVRLINALRRSRPTVVHFQWLPVPLLDQFAVRYLRRHNIPVVLTVHDTTPFNASPTSHGQDIGWRKSLERFDCLIVHTEASRKKLKSLGLTTTVEVVPHGVLTFGNAPDQEKHRGLKVLFFGAVKPYKGVDTLLRAFARIQDKQGAELLIVGNCVGGENSIRSLIAQLDIEESVKFENRFFDDAEIPSMIASADLIVFPYRSIDASGAFLTAIGYGKAFLATDLPTFREFVKERNFALVKHDSVEDLSNKLQEIISNPVELEKLRDCALQIRSEILSWREIGARTLEVYDKVNSGRHDQLSQARE
jgi:glycosyltransferase involved in cell wall biosynthesis